MPLTLYHGRVKKCAFLTLDERGDFVIDDEHAIEPLADLGWLVSMLSWRQTRVPWATFDAVVIRSTWDYWNDVPAFLDTLARVDRETRLANPLELVRWNLEKTYLRKLESNGVGIVPTMWPEAVEPDSFAAYAEQLGSEELVIKPVVGANGEDAFRVSPSDPARRREKISAVFRGRRALVQPFLPRVLTEGEFSLFYFNGTFSHAILKTPAASEFRSQEERGAVIRPVEPERRLLECGSRALAALDVVPLYARADFIRSGEDDFLVVELELIEPSMYLRTDPEAPARFARAVDARFSGTTRP
jgi:glutathione synthase/RimK-type ligase-like ATP-grasp enzyme